MVELFGINIGDFGSTFGEIGVVVQYGVIGIFLALGIWFIYEQLKYNKKIIVHDETGTHNIVKIIKAKQWKSRDSTYWWKLLGKGIKKTATIPPKEAISVSTNGKQFAQCRLTPNGDIIWIVPKADIEKVGLTPQEKLILANEFRNSEDWKSQTQGWLAFFNNNAGIISLIIILAIFLSMGGEFYQQVLQPVTSLGSNLAEASDDYKESIQILSDTQQRVRRIEAEVHGNNMETDMPEVAPD